MFFYFNQETPEEAARRALESCGAIAGVTCMMVALDDVFVVPVPTILKAVGFFQPPTILRSRPRRGTTWRATRGRVGMERGRGRRRGRPGLALKATSEQNAVNDALGDCARRDSDCHVIAIGPFLVGPN